MSKRIIVLLTLTIFFLSGCATSEKSILLGSTIGLGLGAGVGSGVNDSQGAAIGALIGAGLGGLIGFQGYRDKVKKAGSQSDDSPNAPYSISSAGGAASNRPHLKPAQVKVKYVEDQIKDGTFIPAHFEYEITEPAKWEN